MPYRKIKADAKVEAVMRVFGGERVSAVADDMGLNRNSLAIWVRKAHESMRSGIESKKGVRKSSASGNGTQLNRLKERAERRFKPAQQVRDHLMESPEGPVPASCVKCGCTRFYKNGFCMVSMERLIGVRISNANYTIPVQKFICLSCGASSHLDGPVALYHWVTGGHRSKNGKSGHAV